MSYLAYEEFLRSKMVAAPERGITIDPALKLFSGKRSERVRPSKEWLRQQYEVEHMDCPQLAKILQVDSKTAWCWVREAGIETRKRGFGKPSNHFQPGRISTMRGKSLPEAQKRQNAATMRMRWQTSERLQNRVHWLHKVPAEQNPNWKGGVTPERQAFYRSAEWKACVRIIWKRDNATCQRCGLDHRTVDRKEVLFHLHHIDSFVIVECRADPDNLVLLCKPCHNWVHSRENVGRVFLGKGQEFGVPPLLSAEKSA